MATKDTKKIEAVEATEATETVEAVVLTEADKPAKPRRAAKATKAAEDVVVAEVAATEEIAVTEEPKKPARAPRAKKAAEAVEIVEAVEAAAVAEDEKAEKAEKAEKPKRAPKAAKTAEVEGEAKAEKSEKDTETEKPAKATKPEKKSAKPKAEEEEVTDPFSIRIVNNKGEKVGTEKLNESIFGIAPNINVMHQVCRAQLAAGRAGTHDTKTRGEVSGGGRKPFRQKGTGRARQGTIRAPQYKGGGVVFGPHPRSYAFKVNNKEVKLAMRSALSAKQAEGVLYVVDSFEFEKPSTREAAKCLEALNIAGRVTLMLTDDELNAFLSFRNIPRVRVVDVVDANTYDFVDNKALVFTKAALKHIEEVLQ